MVYGRGRSLVALALVCLFLNPVTAGQTDFGNGTDPTPPPKELDTGLGLVAVAISIVFFGSNFIPIKQHETGDGIFFQFVLATGIFTVGSVVNLIQKTPKFHALAILGGVVWCTGNLMTVPIVKRIGLGMGLLVWGGSSMVVGWASGVFGFFGTNNQRHLVDKWGLNIAGVFLGLVSLALSSQIETTVGGEPTRKSNTLRYDEAAYDPMARSDDDEVPSKVGPTTLADKLAGYVMAILAGACYGLNFIPPQYVMDRYDDVSKKGLDYVFPHFCGIFLSSLVYFLVYCGYMLYRQRKVPTFYPKVVIPGFVSGLMWGIAQSSWFVANDNLKQVLTYPLISLGPGFLGALYSVFWFREIQGRRNFLILFGVFVFLAAASAMIVSSKKKT